MGEFVSTIAELIAEVVRFAIELIVEAVKSLILLFRAIFSPPYREELRQSWNGSTGARVWMIFGALMNALILAVVIYGGVHISKNWSDKTSSSLPTATGEEKSARQKQVEKTTRRLLEIIAEDRNLKNRNTD